MSVPVWVADLSARFWEVAGEPPSPPRCLISPALSALPLAVEELPGLDTEVISRRLDAHGVRGFRCYSRRALHGCLVARDGVGFIFLNADDSLEERRFSFAHELSHFLRDYWRPRCNAAARFGERIVEVFDGHRGPTPEERLAGLFRECRLTTHVHLMEREPGGMSGEVAASEGDADRLAFELLAPADRVLTGAKSRTEVARRLKEEWGLPERLAERYAGALVVTCERDPLWERLRTLLP